MKMDAKQFKKNLLLYGGDVHQWPDEIRQAGLEALEQSSEAQAFMADHAQFEAILQARAVEDPGPDLTQRIIAASLRRKKKAGFSIGAFFSELLAEFTLPKPARSAVSMATILLLLIGIAVGFSDPVETLVAEQDQTSLQEFLYYEGEVL